MLSRLSLSEEGTQTLQLEEEDCLVTLQDKPEAPSRPVSSANPQLQQGHSKQVLVCLASLPPLLAVVSLVNPQQAPRSLQGPDYLARLQQTSLLQVVDSSALLRHLSQRLAAVCLALPSLPHPAGVSLASSHRLRMQTLSKHQHQRPTSRRNSLISQSRLRRLSKPWSGSRCQDRNADH